MSEETVQIRGQVHPREICRFCREVQQEEGAGSSLDVAIGGDDAIWGKSFGRG